MLSLSKTSYINQVPFATAIYVNKGLFSSYFGGISLSFLCLFSVVLSSGDSVVLVHKGSNKEQEKQKTIVEPTPAFIPPLSGELNRSIESHLRRVPL